MLKDGALQRIRAESVTEAPHICPFGDVRRRYANQRVVSETESKSLKATSLWFFISKWGCHEMVK